jgi:hypothetical protein
MLDSCVPLQGNYPLAGFESAEVFGRGSDHEDLPWLEHEILHRREPDGSFARTRTHSVHFYYLFPASSGLRFFPNAGSISLRLASVKRGRGVRWLLARPEGEQSIRR